MAVFYKYEYRNKRKNIHPCCNEELNNNDEDDKNTELILTPKQVQVFIIFGGHKAKVLNKKMDEFKSQMETMKMDVLEDLEGNFGKRGKVAEDCNAGVYILPQN